MLFVVSFSEQSSSFVPGPEKQGNRFLTDTLQPDVIVVKPGATVAGIRREEIRTLSVLTNVGSKHFTLIRI